MTWIHYGFFGFACFCALVCLISSLPIRRPVPILIFPIFLVAIMTTELTWFFVAVQLVITLLFVANGALEQPLGLAALGLMLVNWLGMWRLHRQGHAADGVLGEALRQALGADFRAAIPAERQAVLRDSISARDWLRPLSMSRPGVERLVDIAYGDAGERNLLDIYRPVEGRERGCPVLLQVHGGGWFMGHKQQQALPLLHHMASRGWLCVSINYRLSPDARFPDHVVDVKKAIHWIRENIDDYGGDSGFIAITGGSAGGHLTAITALTANDPALQPGFEEADTRVDAAVPLYGVYDFLDREDTGLNAALLGFVADKVFPGPPQECPDLWQQLSPVYRVHADAPPFFVLHGASDVMTSWEVARTFSGKLAEISARPVAHAELPGAQHAFDSLHSVRSEYMLNHITDFLEWARTSSRPGAE